MTEEIVQGSDAWKQMRLGKVTASRVADVIAKTKTGYGASRANYMAELIAERLTGAQAEGYTNAAMQWGKDHEADACDAYAFRAWEVEAGGTMIEAGCRWLRIPDFRAHVAACLNLAAGCLDDAAKELRQAATRLHTRPFTGPCRTWSDQAKTLSSEDIEASLGAQKLESQP